MNQGKRKTWPSRNGGPDTEQTAKGISRLMMKDNPRTMAKPQVESHAPRLIRRTKELRTKEETRTRGYLMCSNKLGGDLQLQIRVWGCTVDQCRENKRKTNKNENKNTINFRENKIWARQEV